MTTSESIEVLLDDVQGIQIAKPPPGPHQPKFFMKADQVVETATPGNFITLNHQTVGESIVECLEQLKKQVEGASKLKKKGLSAILTRGGARE
jgi:hypothetical protein